MFFGYFFYTEKVTAEESREGATPSLASSIYMSMGL